jgi:hypothetical protein
MRAGSKCLQQRRNAGKCLSPCHLKKHNLINSLRASLKKRISSGDDVLKALAPKISPLLQEGLDGPLKHEAVARMSLAISALGNVLLCPHIYSTDLNKFPRK